MEERVELRKYIEANFAGIKKVCNRYAYQFFLKEEDLTSAVSMKLSEIVYESAFDGCARQFWGYLKSVTRNAAIDMLREQPPPALDIDRQSEWRDAKAAVGCLMQEFNVRDLCARIRDALPGLLGEKDAQVFELHVFQGLKCREVAEIAGVPLSYVKVIIYRSRQKLKKHYGDDYKELLRD